MLVRWWSVLCLWMYSGMPGFASLVTATFSVARQPFAIPIRGDQLIGFCLMILSHQPGHGRLVRLERREQYGTRELDLRCILAAALLARKAEKTG